jgi:exosortase A-associated hydrolase 2
VTPAVEAFYLAWPGGVGSRLCVHHPSRTSPARGLVLYVHPFAEEMNKSRRMAALQARALAGAGYAVMLLDLFGCGDSAGDFGDARWDIWVDDVVAGARWLTDRYPHEEPPLWLWGLRAGCLVAASAQRRIGTPCNLLFWQPVQAGRLTLRQFLRLKTMADAAGSTGGASADKLKAELAEGRSLEIAGYRLSPALARGIDEARLEPTARGERLVWFELSLQPDAALAPAALESVAGWRAAGFEVQTGVVSGPAFWQTVEIEEAPLLIEHTTLALRGVSTARLDDQAAPDAARA